MVRPIMRSIAFLKLPSAPATIEDLPLAEDLLCTIRAHRDECVGMAANMIGESKRIIVFEEAGKYTVMLNPEIIKCEGAYKAEEGCLSLVGTREAKRYEIIKVRYQTERLQQRLKTYRGRTAQIIQHEIDHLNGVII